MKSVTELQEQKRKLEDDINELILCFVKDNIPEINLDLNFMSRTIECNGQLQFKTFLVKVSVEI